jgi:hypothetical protein
VPEDVRLQHVKAIQAIRDLGQSDLVLKIETKRDGGMSDTTYIQSGTGKGLLHAQINGLKVPDGCSLSRVQVFSSLDGTLALNIFSFEGCQSTSLRSQKATTADAGAVMQLIEEIKANKHVDNPGMPKYSALLDTPSMEDFLGRLTTTHVVRSDPRRLLIQRLLFDEVKGREGSAVHLEPHKIRPGQACGVEGSNSSHAWVTVAAANVLPEVLLRTCSAIITAKGLDIRR